MQTKRWDIAVLAVGGVVLWIVAGGFLWRDLQVPPEAFLVLGSAVAAGLAIKRLPENWSWVGPAAMLWVSAAGAIWFFLTKTPILIPALGITTVVTAIALRRAKDATKVQRLLLWYGLVVAVLACTGAAYFHIFTARYLADEVGRRLILSFVWVCFGVGLVGSSARRQNPFARDAGFAALAVAVGKILVYDTMHLGGTLRIAALLGGGALLIGGAVFASRFTPRLNGEVRS
jgi:hypothetical protein